MNCTRVCNNNGTIEIGEECDDSNSINNDGCTLCNIDTGYECNTPGSLCTPICGDGILVGLENCDDFSVSPGYVSGCEPGCQSGALSGFHCTGGSIT